MQNRVSGGRRAATPVFASSLRVPTNQVILGIDPSLRGTGYGVIRTGKPHPQTLAHGTIVCPAGWEQSRCLVKIAQTLRDVVKQHRPTVCVVEGLFYAQNLQTALTMGEARGAALVIAAEAGLEIYEIAPRKVKQAIVGYGAAQKLAATTLYGWRAAGCLGVECHRADGSGFRTARPIGRAMPAHALRCGSRSSSA